MSEKRYFKKEYEEEYYIFDSEKISEKDFDERYEYDGYVAFEDSMQGDEVVDTLNEQQATISKQLDQIIELQDKYRILEFNHKRLEKRNKKQYEKIGEQQATINKLQEENKQLKIANAKWLDESLQDKQIRYDNPSNKELVRKYLQLKEENEQLKEEIRAYPINEEYAEEIIQQNQKLRIERNDLRRENKQLRKELDSFKPVIFQDMRKGTVILYSKGVRK